MTEKKCRRCSKTIPSDAKFCSHCGKKQNLTMFETFGLLSALALMVLIVFAFVHGIDRKLFPARAALQDAYTQCCGAAKYKVLTGNPSFRNCPPFDKEQVSKMDDGSFAVSSYIEIQDGHGGKSEVPYTCNAKIVDQQHNRWSTVVNVE